MTSTDSPSRRNTGPAGTTMSAILAEDVVFARGTISVLADGPVALFANPFREGAEELFVVDTDRKLTYVHRTAAGDGWIQDPFETDVPYSVSNVVTAVHPDGTVWLFVSYGSAKGELDTFRLDGHGAWEPVALPGPPAGWNNLSVHYLPDRPATPVIVGVDYQRTRVQVLKPRFTDLAHSWETVRDVSLPTPLPELFHAGLQPDGTLRVYADDGQAITCHTYLAGGWQADVQVPGATGGRLAGLWNAPEGLGCVFLGNDSIPRAYTPLAGQDGVTWSVLSATQLKTASSWQDERGMLHIFGVGLYDSVLHVIHQDGWTSQKTELGLHQEPLFVAASADSQDVVSFPLAAGVSGVDLDPAPDAYPSQLLVPAQPGAAYRIASQDVTTSWWSEEPVTLAGLGGVAQLERRYLCDVTLVDGFGAPLPAWPVQLSARSALEVELSGRMIRLAPTETAHAVTDGQGRIRLRVAARGLTVPAVQVAAKGIAQGANVDLASGVQAFLAGTSVLAAHPELLSAQQLLDAKVSTGWLVAGWHDTDASGVALPDAQTIVEVLTMVYASTHGTPQLRTAGDSHGLLLQRSRPDQPTSRALEPGETARGALGVSGDLTPYAHDLWQGIRDGVLDVVGFSIGAKGVAVKCEAPDGTAIGFVQDLVTASDASLAVEAIFQFLHAGVDRLVEWLAQPFPFGNVWSAAEALAAGFEELPTVLSSTANHYHEYAKPGWFEAHQTEAGNALEALREPLDGLRIDSLQGLGMLTPGLPTAIYENDTLVTPRSSWVHDLLLQHQPPRTSSPDGLDPVRDPIWLMFTDSPWGEGFQVALDTARTNLLALWDLEDSRTVDGTPVQALVDIAEGLLPQLLPLADVLVDPLCTAVTTIAGKLDGLLSTLVLDPELAAAYEWFQRMSGIPAGHEKALTIGGLGALYAAFPIAGAYETLLDSCPFAAGTFPSLPSPPWETPSSQVIGDAFGQQMQVVGGLARLFSAGVDELLDTAVPGQWLSMSIACFELTGSALAGYPPYRGISSDTDAGDQVAWAQWALSSMLASLDLYLSCELTDHPLVTTYSGWQGSGLLGAVGAAQIVLAGAAWAASEQKPRDADLLATSVAAALPALTAPLRQLQGLPPDQRWAGAGMAFKTLVDLAADSYAGSRQTALAVYESRDSS